MAFVVLNGKLLSDESPLLSVSNRSFRFGDSVFESIHLYKGEILFFEKHIERLLHAMNILKMEIPSWFDVAFFHKHISDCLTANGLFSDAKIRLQVWRAGSGVYSPDEAGVEYLIETQFVTPDLFCNTNNKVVLGLFNEYLKPIHASSTIKTGNSLLYVLAGLYAKQNGFTDVLVLNQNGTIADSVGANVFYLKNDCWFTTDDHQAAINGVMQKALIDFFSKQKLEVIKGPIALSELGSADEIFLCNMVKGIMPVADLQNKKYLSAVTEKLAADFCNQFNQ